MNILGYEYDVEVVKDGDKDQLEKFHKEDMSAYVDYDKRKMKIDSHCYDFDNKIEGIKSDTTLLEDLLHESAHIFLHHSGNADLNNERHAELLCHFFKAVSKDMLSFDNICNGKK